MKLLNEPTLTFEQVTIQVPKRGRAESWKDWFKKPETNPIHFLGRSTWNKLEFQFDSMDEIKFGQSQWYETDVWKINMYVIEVDPNTLQGIAYINFATRKDEHA